MIPMYNFGKPCTYCSKNTRYVARIGDEHLYFCKYGCKDKYISKQITEAFLRTNPPKLSKLEIKGFKIEEIEKSGGDRFSIVLRSKNPDGSMNGHVLLFRDRKDMDFLNINDEYEVVITKKVK